MSVALRQKMDFDSLRLDSGAHSSPTEGMCVIRIGHRIAQVADADLERFRGNFVVPEDPSECIRWTGYIWPTNGYGRFWVGQQSFRAHRFCYALSSDLPPGITVDHICHNADLECPGGVACLHRRCVNPLHLEGVSIRPNLLRSPHAPSGVNARKTHCPQGHPYDDENTLVRSNGIRECRECGRGETRRYLAAHRQEHNARRRAARAARRSAQ